MAEQPGESDLVRGPRAPSASPLPYTGRPPAPGPASFTTRGGFALPVTETGSTHVAPVLLPPVRRVLDIQTLYRPDDGLIAAANVALTLRLPLLLSGRPGTGKTEMARSLAATLHGEKDAERRLYRVTITSAADKSDLLYRYDELARLRDAYEKTSDRTGRRYLRLRGLGQAIVAAGRPGDALEPMAPGSKLPDGLRTLIDLVGEPSPVVGPDPRLDFFLTGSAPPVVLLDEIDKAPRDLPNDLLTELDAMTFDIPELGVRVRLHDETRWPVVVITSNAERPLSEAFLRRCICYEVDVPQGETLRAIIESKLANLALLEAADSLPAEIVAFVGELQDGRVVAENEQPGIARILDFAVLLADPKRLGYASLREIGEGSLRACLTALLPSRAAQDAAFGAWQSWQQADFPTPTRK